MVCASTAYMGDSWQKDAQASHGAGKMIVVEPTILCFIFRHLRPVKLLLELQAHNLSVNVPDYCYPHLSLAQGSAC